MTVQPTVTVCIPTYNRPEMLRASLQSVLWQSYRDIEVIVSDNASVTNTFEVVESFGDPRVRIDPPVTLRSADEAAHPIIHAATESRHKLIVTV